MKLRTRDPAGEGESLGTLFSRLLEDATRLARAEINYYKQLALHRVTGAASGLVMALVALLVVQAALTALVIGLGMALARWLGPAGGVIAMAVIALIVAGLLGWIGAKRITAAAAGADEASALAKERRR